MAIGMVMLLLTISTVSSEDIDILDIQWIQQNRLCVALRIWDKTVVADTDLQTGDTVVISKDRYVSGTQFCPSTSKRLPLLLCPLNPMLVTPQGFQPLKVNGFRFHFGDLISLRQFSNGTTISIWTGHEWGGIFRNYLLLHDEERYKSVAYRLSKHSFVRVGEVSRLFGNNRQYFLILQRDPLQNGINLCLYSFDDHTIIHQLPFAGLFLGFDVCGPEDRISLFYQKDDALCVSHAILQDKSIVLDQGKTLPSNVPNEFRSFSLKDDSLYIQDTKKLHFVDLISLKHQCVELNTTRISANPFGSSLAAWDNTNNVLFLVEPNKMKEKISSYYYKWEEGKLEFVKIVQ